MGELHRLIEEAIEVVSGPPILRFSADGMSHS
jgi:hypothetical protein